MSDVSSMNYVFLLISGMVAGLLGGLLGIGGSSIMLPAMVMIFGSTSAGGVDQIHQYMAAAMIVNFLLAIPSVTVHARNRAIWRGVWAPLAAAAMVGLIAGVQLSFLFSGEAAKYLRWCVGGFFAYVAVFNFYCIIDRHRFPGLEMQAVEAEPIWRKFVIGGPMGLLAGLLGIGGGSLAVPAQQIVMKMPLRNAIATSAATIATISWLGAILKNAQLGDNGTVTRSLVLAACLAPTAMIGGYIGSHLTHKAPLRLIRVIFAASMILSALKMWAVL